MVVKIKFRGVPKIRRAMGTDDPDVVKDILLMFRALYKQGHLAHLEAIARKRLHPLQVLDYWRRGKLVDLPPADVLPRLSEAWMAWEERVPGDDHRSSIGTTRRALGLTTTDKDGKVCHTSYTLAELPDLFLAYKKRASDKIRSVNLARNHCRTFLRETVGTSHELYVKIKDMQPLKKKPRERGTPHSVATIREVCQKLAKISGDPRVGMMAWSMAASGMGNKEYWNDGFEVGDDRVLIHGQKRDQRDREVMRWTAISGPVCWEGRFRTLLRKASDGKVAIYDLRRSFLRWCEEAGIIMTNIDAYAGHGPKTMTGLYTFGQLPGQLIADAEKMTAYAGGEAPVKLAVVA